MRARAESCPVRAWLSRPENLRDLHRVASHYAGGGVQGDEVASQAMERALAHADKFVSGDVGAWVRTIVRRLGVNAQRDAATRRRVYVLEGELGEHAQVEGAHEPSRAWDADLLLDVVREEARREGVEREFTRYMDGENGVEIGRALGVSGSTVGRRLARLSGAFSAPASTGPQSPQSPRPQGPRGAG